MSNISISQSFLTSQWDCYKNHSLNNTQKNVIDDCAWSISLPLSVLKKLDTVSTATPFFFEKMCPLSAGMKMPLRLHSALQSFPNPRLSGGGPHPSVTSFPKNSSDGLTLKCVLPSMDRQKKKLVSKICV